MASIFYRTIPHMERRSKSIQARGTEREELVKPPGQFRAHRLEDNRVLYGTSREVIGSRLIAHFSSPLPLNTALKIDADDYFLLGEILASWYEDDLFVCVIELRHQLSRLAELTALAHDFLEETAELMKIAR